MSGQGLSSQFGLVQKEATGARCAVVKSLRPKERRLVKFKLGGDGARSVVQMRGGFHEHAVVFSLLSLGILSEHM